MSEATGTAPNAPPPPVLPGVRVAFIVDTSASMNQRSLGGMRLLDVAKSLVEGFLTRLRNRGTQPPAPGELPTPRIERLFLITCGSGGDGQVHAGWGDSYATFIRELKTLRATDMTSLGPAMRKALELLSAFRPQTGADSYSQGRCPWVAEPSLVILITDGGALTSVEPSAAVSEQFSVPRSQLACADLTLEPFRWDQRVFSVVLRLPGVSSSLPQQMPMPSQPQQQQAAPAPDPAVAPMCEVTGGKCITVQSMKALGSAVDLLVSRSLFGVVVNFEQMVQQHHGTAQTAVATAVATGTCAHKTLYFSPGQLQMWPIPESYFPDPSMTAPPARTAQPTIKFVALDSDSRIPEGFPYDKYDVENSPLVTAMQPSKPGMCWQTFISGSGHGGGADPFGFLKLGAKRTTVHLFVLPYNYPRLWSLIDDLSNPQSKASPSQQWKQKFDAYLQTVPPYYMPSLRLALGRMGIGAVIPGHLDGSMSFQVQSQLKMLKQRSKHDTERMLLPSKPTKDGPQAPLFVPMQRPAEQSQSQSQTRSFHALLDRSERASVYGASQVRPESLDANSAQQQMVDAQAPAADPIVRNAFEIPRSELLRTVALLREKLFFNPDTFAEEAKHKVPIDQMGDYLEVLARKQVLRPVDEEKEKRSRRPLFGNPFRNTKQQSQQLVDEADMIDGQGITGANRRGNSTNAQAGPQKRRSVLERPNSPQQGQPKMKMKKTEMPQAAPVNLSALEVFTANNSLRLALFREVRRPSWSSKDTGALSTLLRQVKGDGKVKSALIDELLEQARLFGSVRAQAVLESAMAAQAK